MHLCNNDKSQACHRIIYNLHSERSHTVSGKGNTPS
ncbi:hypothetical protein E2C01_044537 [Portunus trituberculatus]|uniref:Uncharacterized protein n=1 Tax=Portunus trituberculatus TaxID=210409 RepID=A0A5B7FZF7_PORTR|nr:hypothetical protein [Portunus trituberculatus]